MSAIIQRVVVPLGVSLFSAGATTGGVFLWTSEERQQAKLIAENPNILTIYKKEDSGYLVVGDNENNRWKPSDKNSISLGEKGWQLERQGSRSQDNKDYFQVKREGDSSQKEALTNNKGIDSNSDLNGAIKIYLSGSNCENFKLDSNLRSANLDLQRKFEKIEEGEKKGFAFWVCTNRENKK